MQINPLPEVEQKQIISKIQNPGTKPQNIQAFIKSRKPITREKLGEILGLSQGDITQYLTVYTKRRKLKIDDELHISSWTLSQINPLKESEQKQIISIITNPETKPKNVQAFIKDIKRQLAHWTMIEKVNEEKKQKEVVKDTEQLIYLDKSLKPKSKKTSSTPESRAKLIVCRRLGISMPSLNKVLMLGGISRRLKKRGRSPGSWIGIWKKFHKQEC